MNTNSNPSEASFSNYLDKLQKLKERNVIRQVLTQELLQEIIESNKDKINEYPLPETQRSSIIKFLTHRGSGYPQHEPIQKLLDNFLNALNRYEKKLYLNEKDNELQNLKSVIKNLEILLLKCVQMVVYTQALIQDNISEILVKYFGEESQSTLDKFVEEMEMDENFWKSVYRHFFVDFVNNIYSQLAENDISISKEEAKLMLFIPFDSVFTYLQPADKEVEKTRVQELYNFIDADQNSYQNSEIIYTYLNQLIDSGDNILKKSDTALLCRIISMDPAGDSFRKAYAYYFNQHESGSTSQDEGEIGKEFADLMFKQVQFMAYSISLTLKIVQNDFSRALYDIEPKKQSRAISLLGSFGLNEIATAFEYLLQCQLINILQQKAASDSKKIYIQSIRTPRISQDAVDNLSNAGLTKIAKNKLLEKDQDKEGHYLFQPKTINELQDILRTLQCEKRLAEEIYKQWKYAQAKTVIVVSIDLQMLSKTTSNTTKRLAEILNRYGLRSTGS